MRTTFFGAMTVLGLAMGAVAPAQAAGCLKGAVVGGVAGHFAHHGVLGAGAGCVIGHHEAAKHEREAAAQQHDQQADHSPAQ